MPIREVTIIGAGPAGLATAIQLKRSGVDFILFEKSEVGGLLANANLVENYPGFPGGIPGFQLVERLQQQIEEISVRVTFEKVTALHYENGLFLTTTGRQVYPSRRVVVASGTRPIAFSGGEIPESLHDRVYYEILPIQQIEEKQVAVVGGGDLAFDYALNLGRKNDVIILNRGEETKCLALLWERAQASPRIRYLDRTCISRIEEKGQNRIELRCISVSREVDIQADYLIFAIGREPQLEFMTDELQSEAQELENMGVLYLIGDVKNGIYRQAAIAVGDGVLAAMKIHRLLEESTL